MCSRRGLLTPPGPPDVTEMDSCVSPHRDFDVLGCPPPTSAISSVTRAGVQVGLQSSCGTAVLSLPDPHQAAWCPALGSASRACAGQDRALGRTWNDSGKDRFRP